MRLLIVEDEVRMAALLRRGFVEEGYAVDIANNGTDAVWLATEATFDTLILDVMLPGVDGFEVCRVLREKGCRAPVLMLTARDAVEDRVRGLDAGADDYLTKPFSFAELSARVRALLRRGASARPTVLEVGDLRLDPAAHRATRADAELSLSPKEMALLELFMRHPDEVITRTQILDHVWDFAYDGMSNVVDQYVSYLRRKIDKPFGRDDLQTVRGVGYRLRTSER
ncbi:MAG: two-component system, OmpR family, response regulator [Actinomycetota bacterium]|jgi:two-component system, OmpR family, response regulator|nr:two-component system, OmpR family, response regulator [Actinomycetota bacterium]